MPMKVKLLYWQIRITENYQETKTVVVTEVLCIFALKLIKSTDIGDLMNFFLNIILH